ncbi:hypothetical protein PVAP13_2NG459700 [Panicum virgatum]|uniref:Uncharacterized protein n=1 Tax=Panicum virgatum TaxID=38727 RepID=A0A8T0VCF7_PANVG|nr:hypothetical protein PVAP13_2NG459700 [Panicum virgatum]
MRSRPLGLSHVLRPKCLPLSTGGSSGASSNLERYINTISHVCSVSKASIGVQATVGSGCIEKKRKEKKELASSFFWWWQSEYIIWGSYHQIYIIVHRAVLYTSYCGLVNNI